MCSFVFVDKTDRYLVIFTAFNNIISLSNYKVSILAMTQTDTTISDLNRLKDKIQNFPLKCRLFLNLLLSDTLPTHQFQIPKTFKKNFESFENIFKKFSSEEKSYFICELFRHVQAFLNGTRNVADNMINQIETSCQMKSITLGFTFWQRRNFKYCAQQHVIKLFTSKKQDVIDLKKYLIRKSNSQSNSLVLEAVNNQVSYKLIKVTLKFSNMSIMSEIFSNIRTAMIAFEEKKLEQLIRQDLKERSIQKVYESNKRNKNLTILTQKIMTQYFNTKEKDLQKLSFQRAQANIIYNRNQVKIFRSKQNKKYYFLQFNLESSSINSLKQKIMFLNEDIKQKTYSCQVLESFNQNLTANYYKMQISKQEYQFIVIIQKNQKEDSFTQIIRGINNFSMGTSIQFGLVTLRKLNNHTFNIQFYVLLDFHQTKKSNRCLKAVNLLRQLAKENWKFQGKPINSTGFVDGNQSLNKQNLCKSLTNDLDYSKKGNIHGNQQKFVGSSDSKSVSLQSIQKDNQNVDQQQFFVTIQNYDDNEEIVIHSFQESMFQNCEEDSFHSTSHSNKNELLLQKQKNYLNVKYQMKPSKNCPLKQLKSHFLFGDWQRGSKGGVILVNEEVNNKQKKIVRLLLARLGNSILSGNGIMNVSLPVQMFKNESQLVSIARNFTYTPYLIEPSVGLSPLEKMKKFMIFHISIQALSLSTQKPFNPILGQTYQAEINGCPIYLQQISHHPPVSYIYMVGRGYKIYGSNRIDIHLRLNHVKGLNDAPLFLQYDDGDKIEFSVPIMIINGLLIGERSLYFEGTIYFIDRKNLLVACINYNSNSKKGLFSFKSESPDFLTGQIYEVTPSFLQKFIASNKTIPPKKELSNKLLASITGEWNGKVYINDKLIFNFEEDLPVQLENCNYPLLSDSTIRTDVQFLTKGEMSQSQQQKDKLQILQRRDRKLRQAHQEPKGQK